MADRSLNGFSLQLNKTEKTRLLWVHVVKCVFRIEGDNVVKNEKEVDKRRIRLLQITSSMKLTKVKL